MNEEWYNDRIRIGNGSNWVRFDHRDPQPTFTSNDQRPNYDSWLNQIVSSYQTILESKAEGKPDSRDRAFAKFLLDLPSIPADVLDLLRDLSVDPEKYVSLLLNLVCQTTLMIHADRMHVGFTSLREFVLERPSLRAEALRVLLDLTTHPGMAIMPILMSLTYMLIGLNRICHTSRCDQHRKAMGARC